MGKVPSSSLTVPVQYTRRLGGPANRFRLMRKAFFNQSSCIISDRFPRERERAASLLQTLARKMSLLSRNSFIRKLWFDYYCSCRILRARNPHYVLAPFPGRTQRTPFESTFPWCTPTWSSTTWTGCTRASKRSREGESKKNTINTECCGSWRY